MPDTPPRLLVACFCAAWCRTCDDYAHVMAALKVQFAQQVQFAWVDIEDQAEVLDNVDVENFPTLLISDAQQVYFWGTVLPHAATAAQLIDRVLSGDIRALNAPDILQLDQRLRSFLFS
jgi:thioredoxin 1